MPTWRDLYHEEIERQAGHIRRAQSMGQTWIVFDGRTYDPTRLSPANVKTIASREAERLINYAINSENAAKRKAGRPDEVTCESID
ncbi:hypothetical protein [Nannocystis pusilla]|uniref:hypothetical protein n=1 Tax=Nannocystis pusilla TaxID=889268 RepID=UPI003DA57B71